MRNKLNFLTKMSLNKKIKTKWFLIANLIFAILIIGIINIDYIIKMFGGDFDETQEILVIDEAQVFDLFHDNYTLASKYVAEYDDVDIVKYDKTYDDALKEVEEDKKILLLIQSDNDNFLKAKIVSNDGVGTITDTLIKATLNTVRSEIALKEYNITEEILGKINASVLVENEVLSDKNTDDDMMVSTMMQVLTLPLFMLVMFLVQMIGAEINEEKTTKSMEIIISNVSPRTHFISKIIASNLFVIIQGALLILFVILGVGVRYVITSGNLIGELGGEVQTLTNTIQIGTITDTLSYMLPVMLIMILLTFFAYSLLAGILASMTTNLEDFQQLQTPIVFISLIGYYLSMMAGIFKGSMFIKVMCYIPLISVTLAPTMYVMGEITVLDLIGSILLLVLLIYLLVKYGLRVYKAGILNYSGEGLWKKMFKAVKNK